MSDYEAFVHVYACLYLEEYTCDARNKNAAERKMAIEKEREREAKRRLPLYECMFKYSILRCTEARH